MTTHECPRPGCNRRVAADEYACRGDWYALPVDIRQQIWRAWRSGDAGAHQAARANAADWYRANPPRTHSPKEGQL